MSGRAMRRFGWYLKFDRWLFPEGPEVWGPVWKLRGRLRTYGVPLAIWAVVLLVGVVGVAWLLDWLDVMLVKRRLGAGQTALGGWWMVCNVLAHAGLVVVSGWTFHRAQRLWVIRNEWAPLCRGCAYRLDMEATDAVRCPECGTLNDARKWVINSEAGRREGSRVAGFVQVVGKSELPGSLRSDEGWEPLFRAFGRGWRRWVQHTITLVMMPGVAGMAYVLAGPVRQWLIGAGAIGANSVMNMVVIIGSAVGSFVLFMVVWVVVYRIWPVNWAMSRGLIPMCRGCGYRLDGTAGEEVRCPECGTLNDASRWVVEEGEGTGTGGRAVSGSGR